jgi:alkanesulfonate monooxygenase SsuD/methylene tetrahydromethanopterin reductase-like flavin-dependent oxidoreductase (luciferase family)
MDVPTKPFSFGVVATPQGGPQRWIASARRIEELGYSSLLMPDGIQLLSPFPSLTLAAHVTERLRVGTFVLAGPLRTPYQAAWEGHSVSVLTGGRFDFGIGTGRPVVKETAATVGMPYGSATERLAQVERAVEILRELDGDAHTPVLMAAGGPKSRALAARLADTITLAAPALAPRSELEAMAASVRAEAGERAAEIELAMNIFVVGDEVPEWTRGFIGADAKDLIAADSMTMLRGTTDEIVAELERRRETIGVSSISVNHAFFEQFAPVVERLAGK